MSTEKQTIRLKSRGAGATSGRYQDPIFCPACGKIHGEWVHVRGTVTIRKWCPRCKAFRLLSKTG